MKMIKLRSAVFETNSSACHSLAILRKALKNFDDFSVSPFDLDLSSYFTMQSANVLLTLNGERYIVVELSPYTLYSTNSYIRYSTVEEKLSYLLSGAAFYSSPEKMVFFKHILRSVMEKYDLDYIKLCVHYDNDDDDDVCFHRYYLIEEYVCDDNLSITADELKLFYSLKYKSGKYEDIVYDGVCKEYLFYDDVFSEKSSLEKLDKLLSDCIFNENIVIHTGYDDAYIKYYIKGIERLDGFLFLTILDAYELIAKMIIKRKSFILHQYRKKRKDFYNPVSIDKRKVMNGLRMIERMRKEVSEIENHTDFDFDQYAKVFKEKILPKFFLDMKTNNWLYERFNLREIKNILYDAVLDAHEDDDEIYFDYAIKEMIEGIFTMQYMIHKIFDVNQLEQKLVEKALNDNHLNKENMILASDDVIIKS